MPETNKILLELADFKYAIWDIIISGLAKAQVTYVQLLFHGENIATKVYQWELLTHQTFSNRI